MVLTTRKENDLNVLIDMRENCFLLFELKSFA